MALFPKSLVPFTCPWTTSCRISSFPFGALCSLPSPKMHIWPSALLLSYIWGHSWPVVSATDQTPRVRVSKTGISNSRHDPLDVSWVSFFRIGNSQWAGGTPVVIPTVGRKIMFCQCSSNWTETSLAYAMPPLLNNKIRQFTLK